jgi:glucose-1-phosphate cytidylyltransferase
MPGNDLVVESSFRPSLGSGTALNVVILCGGLGTRMRDHHTVLPKPLVPIGPKPIVWHIMKYYAHFGHEDFILCLGYKREAFVDFFLNYRYHNSDLTIELGHPERIQFHRQEEEPEGWRVTLADTGLHTNTGGRLQRVARYLDGGPLLLTYGDGLSTVDLHALLAFHQRAGKLATVSAVHPAGRFGEIELWGNEIIRFAEKPQTTAGFINGGFMVLEKEFIARYVDDEPECILEAHALARCARDRQLAAYCHDGFWQCMDNQREHQILEELWESGRAPWKVWAPDPVLAEMALANGR